MKPSEESDRYNFDRYYQGNRGILQKCELIYQTRGRVFHPISKHREMVEKTRRSRVFLNHLQGVWISDETPFRMFDIASQTIGNSWRNQSKSSPISTIIKITYLSLLHCCNFLRFLSMNYK